ncbi:ATP-binding cassette domain-containing protein [Fluviispira vulneris]|uniref:ATP-binding cassette domain-containing protein n=1 Tax=Fluviispira vulneris TaxID=2763012 RepID=UPI0016460AA9|nr:ABC transporter ATP-binding protein [Fluviispira vulneris]
MLSLNFRAEKLFYSVLNKKTLLKDINFEFNEGEIICFLGNNGAGKSTLLKICAGVIEPTYGNVFINKEKINNINSLCRSRIISWLPQSLARAENFNVEEFLLLERDDNINILQKLNIEFSFDFSSVLRDFDIASQAKKEIILLSGGEWKRVQLARIWQRKSKILILDEPDGDLDLKHKINLIEKCKDYVVKNKAIIFIATHDIHFAKMIANRICALNNGVLTWNSKADIFWNLNILKKLYDLNNKDEFYFNSNESLSI